MKSFWWVTLPKKLGWISNWFTQILTDGYYLITFKEPLKTWLSPAALILGFLIGAFHLGYTVIPVETPIIFYAFLAVGILSSHLGFILLLGFAIGDITVLPDYLQSLSVDINPYKSIYWVLFAKIHEYIIFGIGIVLVPVISKLLVASLAKSLVQKEPSLLESNIGNMLFFGTISLINAMLVVALIYFWSNSMTLMIRTIHLHAYIGRRPVEIVQFFQDEWDLLMLTAGMAMIIRSVSQWFSLFNPSMMVISEHYEEAVGEFYSNSGWFDKLPKWINAIFKACFLTFLLEGTFFDEHAKTFDDISFIKFFGSACVIFILNGYIHKFDFLPDWIKKFWNLPIWARFLIAMLLAGGLISVFLKYWHEDQVNFWGILKPTLVSLFIFSVLLPRQEAKSVTQ